MALSNWLLLIGFFSLLHANLGVRSFAHLYNWTRIPPFFFRRKHGYMTASYSNHTTLNTHIQLHIVHNLDQKSSAWSSTLTIPPSNLLSAPPICRMSKTLTFPVPGPISPSKKPANFLPLPSRSKTTAQSGAPPPPPPPPHYPTNPTSRQSKKKDPASRIEQYVGSADDFYTGRRDGDPNRAQAMARYLRDWDRAWDRAAAASGKTNGRLAGLCFRITILTAVG